MDPAAISGIKKASQASAFIRQQLLNFIRPGITTMDIDRHAVELINGTGGISAVHGRNGFPGHIYICLNNQIAHFHSDETVLTSKDLIKIDICLRLDNWAADCAATKYLGDNPDITKLVEANRRAVKETASGLNDGLPLKEISAALNFQKGSFHYFDELTGHSIGEKLHQPPPLPSWKSSNNKDKLKVGQILAIEAVFALSPEKLCHGDNDRIWTSSLNAHHEETILVTSMGSEILTTTPETMS